MFIWVRFMKSENIIQNFLDEEQRVTKFPSKRKKKMYILFYLAEKFEDNREYSEKEINEILLEWHTFSDPATLRRELYDNRFIDRSRDGRVYRLADKQPTMQDLGIE